MNNVENGNTRRRTASRPNNPRTNNRPNSPRPPKNRKRKKKRTNIISVLIIGIIGVVVIALIIMGVKSLFSTDKESSSSSSEPSSILDQLSSDIPESTASTAAAPTPVPVAAKEIDIAGEDVIQFEEMVIVGSRAFDYYKFDNPLATSYTSAINSITASLPSDTNVYNIIIPGAVDIMLPLSFLDENSDKTSDQAKAIKYVSSTFDTSVKSIAIYDALKAHCNEALYFTTDNRWTSLAAYYAYSEWTHSKGLTPTPLNDYDKTTADGFLGNQYAYTHHDAISSPESIDIYKPKSDFTMLYGSDTSDLSDGEVFPDVSDDESDGKIKAFLGGSQNYIKITNPDKEDASACVLVVDSNGGMIAPFFADNYQYTHVIDYRDYSGSLSTLVTDNNAEDVIFCTSIMATTSESMIEGLNNLL